MPWWQPHVRAEIAPFRVSPDNQFILLFPPPFLDFLFARDCSIHVGRLLEVDELVHIVLFRETFDGFGLVLVDTTNKVVSHADVHDLVVPVGEEIDKIAMLLCHRISPFGRNDKRARG